jgi:hypothetical protein
MILGEGSWFNPEGVLPTKDELIHESAGFLVSDTDEGLVVAASVYLGNDEGIRVAGATFIPRSAVVEVAKL